MKSIGEIRRITGSKLWFPTNEISSRGFKGSHAVWRFLSTSVGFQKAVHCNPWYIKPTLPVSASPGRKLETPTEDQNSQGYQTSLWFSKAKGLKISKIYILMNISKKSPENENQSGSCPKKAKMFQQWSAMNLSQNGGRLQVLPPLGAVYMMTLSTYQGLRPPRSKELRSIMHEARNEDLDSGRWEAENLGNVRKAKPWIVCQNTAGDKSSTCVQSDPF